MSVITTCVLTAVFAASPSDEAPSDEQVRETIRRAVPYLEKRGQWWMDSKKCVSCHRVGPMLWTLAAAQPRVGG